MSIQVCQFVKPSLETNTHVICCVVGLSASPLSTSASATTPRNLRVLNDISPVNQRQDVSIGGEASHVRLLPETFPKEAKTTLSGSNVLPQKVTESFVRCRNLVHTTSRQEKYQGGLDVPFHGEINQIGVCYDEKMNRSYDASGNLRALSPVLPPNSTPVNQDSWHSTASNHPSVMQQQPPGTESSLERQQPYDTERAMKECVSKLREKARNGKTVLYNPDVSTDTFRTQIHSGQAQERLSRKFHPQFHGRSRR
jgi:hypothetical protein